MEADGSPAFELIRHFFKDNFNTGGDLARVIGPPVTFCSRFTPTCRQSYGWVVNWQV